MSAQTQERTRHQRIKSNCKKIWGADKEFEINIETGDYHYYLCFVRQDHGFSFGPTLVMTNVCNGSDRAWNELDRMLRLWARQVESGRPMTREERLEIFSGPNGAYRSLLETVMNKEAQMDALAAAKKA